jgi:hypothetical protein
MNTLSIKSYSSMPSCSASETFIQNMLKTLLSTGVAKSTIVTRLGISMSTLNRLLRGTYLATSPKTFANLLGLYCAATYSDQQSSEMH